jgi:hypothetical protein
MNIMSDWLNIAAFFVNIAKITLQINGQPTFWIAHRPRHGQGKALGKACQFRNKQLYFLAPIFFV